MGFFDVRLDNYRCDRGDKQVRFQDDCLVGKYNGRDFFRPE